MEVRVLSWAPLEEWFFVAFRAMHSIVQLGKNDVRKRVVAFAGGLLMLLLLWVQILLYASGV